MAAPSNVVILLILANAVLAVDRTIEKDAVGADVVLATIAKIEAVQNLFESDKRLLRRIAYVETADGERAPSSNSAGEDFGGIWNVGRQHFEATKTDEKLADYRKNISLAFEITWEMVQLEDLSTPLWSALAARLAIELANTAIPTASDIAGQARFWEANYSSDGDVEKFISDVEQLQKDETCNIKSDIIFVLDTSGSIGSENFEQVINFTYEFAEGLEIGPNENQIGVILFGIEGSVVFNLSTYSIKEPLLRGIRNIAYDNAGSTNTADGLCLLLEEGYVEENGARLSSDDVFRLAIVLTDGKSNRDSERCDGYDTLQAAAAVHRFPHSILVFAIGVTDNVNDNELQAIASSEDYITHLVSFDANLFREASDEQTYELCTRSTIESQLGQQEGTIQEEGNVRYEYQVPNEGMTVRLCVSQGRIVFYASFTVTNPNDAFYDVKREVFSTGPTRCDDAFITPITKADMDPNTSNRKKRQNVEEQASGNTTVPLYVSLEGVDEQNEFVLETSEGDNRVKGQGSPSERWYVVVGTVCSGAVLLTGFIVYLSLAFCIMRRRDARQRNKTV